MMNNPKENCAGLVALATPPQLTQAEQPTALPRYHHTMIITIIIIIIIVVVVIIVIMLMPGSAIWILATTSAVDIFFTWSANQAGHV